MTAEEWMRCEDPHLMLAAIPNASERKLTCWVEACRDKSDSSAEAANGVATMWLSVHAAGLEECVRSWSNGENTGRNLYVSMIYRANLLRDIFGNNPFRSKACESCHGLGTDRLPYQTSPELFGKCRTCKATGRVPDPLTIDPRWLASTVIGIARGIYEENAWDRMPILADALMDEGCQDKEILEHCLAGTTTTRMTQSSIAGISYEETITRPPIDHCRGCWVADLILQLG